MTNLENCNDVETILKYYEKLFYKYQYDHTVIQKLSNKKNSYVNELKSKIELMKLLLKNNIFYLSDTNDILMNQIRSTL